MTTSYIDLHIHSSYSDGVLSPSELVERAKRLQIATIALADHDTVGGIGEAIVTGEQLGVSIIPAVELSVEYGSWQDVHLLGYGIDYNNDRLIERLNSFRQQREHRNQVILERVNQRLINEGRAPLLLSQVLSYARDTIGRPHIARALLEKRYVSSVEDAFRRYLKPCNVPKFYWPIVDAMAMIREVGGCAVLAHPTSITSDRQELEKIIRELVELGLAGIEVHNNLAQLDEQERLRRLALSLGIISTAGSDFHGIEEGLEMGKGRGGMRFNTSLLAPLYAALAQRPL